MNKKERVKATLKKIENCIMNDKCELIDCGYYGALSSLQELLHYYEDVEEVIRCKECRYYIEKDSHCTLWSMEFKEDFYCASAEAIREIDKSEFNIK